MHFAKAHAAGKLWWDAIRDRWSLRRAAGEGQWQLILHTVRWLQLLPRQHQWLRALNGREMTRLAAKADPRLYERWHYPYISKHFDLDTRRQMVSSHYTVMLQRFPAALCDSVVRGHSVRLASLWLEDVSRVYLHLGKPMRADAGELQLSLLTQDRETLASCILTFDRHDSLTVGAMRGAGPHTPVAARSAFIRSSHGLSAPDLLVSLVQAMAATLGMKRVLAVTSSASVARSERDDGDDAFWRLQGALPAHAGCHVLPLSPMATPLTDDDPGSHRKRRHRREAFRRQACENLVAAFAVHATPLAAGSTSRGTTQAAVASSLRAQDPAKAASETRNLLAANL